jgi:hypothetical protein
MATPPPFRWQALPRSGILALHVYLGGRSDDADAYRQAGGRRGRLHGGAGAIPVRVDRDTPEGSAPPTWRSS